MTDQPLLEARNLHKEFTTSEGILDRLLDNDKRISAVDDVNLALYENDSIGVIGESGCGKTTLLLTLMGLQRPTEGSIYYRGEDTATFDKEQWKEFRRKVQIIFQDPFNSLDPKLTVRKTLGEPLKVHGLDNKEERIYETMEQVELRPPEEYLDRYPKELSGGEKQRVSIARALILEPEVILTDEPVSMLDVSTQASILRLFSDLITDLDVALVYISHDLSTVSYICDRIGVMYLGRIVETAPTKTLLQEPKHPYTQALIEAIPVPDPFYGRERTNLKGAPETPTDSHVGCRFKDRCPERMEVCENQPSMVGVDPDHRVACHLYYDHESESRAEAPQYADETGGI